MLVKYKKQLTIIYIVLLAVYPMLRVGQGLSIMDTTYSVSNYKFFGEMNGTWMVATYLANVLGSLIMMLPFGSGLLGVNIYTSLLVGGTAVVAFVYLKRDIPEEFLFIGELLALSLCWCPTTLLYNYLTYFLFTLGAMTLYRALSGGRKDLFIAAGIILGLNVTTRFPNIVEAALICAVWYVGYIERKKIVDVVKETLMCILGYAIGFFIPLFTIAIRFNAEAYGDMIQTLFAMTDNATDYKPTSMVTAMLGDYIYAWKWMALFFLAALGCGILFHVLYVLSTGIGDKKSILKIKYPGIICLAVSVLCTGFVIRIVYGQGMFSFRYYEYGSMYFWAVIFIAISTIVSLIFIFAKERVIKPVAGTDLDFHHKKILGCIVVIITYVTCIGSNNAMFPIVNNLFIVAPFLLWCLTDYLKSVYHNPNKHKLICAVRYGGSFVGIIVAAVLLIQGILFHSQFALQDGDEGQPRNSYITGYNQVAHIATTETNAKNLQSLMDYIAENGDDTYEVILYGDVPGLGFLLDKNSALTTFWPDLNSYTYAEWERDMYEIEKEVQSGMPAPYVITSIQVAAWLGGDETAISFWGVDVDKYSKDKKLDDLISFLDICGYEQVFCNDGYSVYYVE